MASNALSGVGRSSQTGEGTAGAEGEGVPESAIFGRAVAAVVDFSRGYFAAFSLMNSETGTQVVAPLTTSFPSRSMTT